MYHYPCAAGAGTFQDFRNFFLLCPEHIDQAPERCKFTTDILFKHLSVYLLQITNVVNSLNVILLVLKGNIR